MDSDSESDVTADGDGHGVLVTVTVTQAGFDVSLALMIDALFVYTQAATPSRRCHDAASEGPRTGPG